MIKNDGYGTELNNFLNENNFLTQYGYDIYHKELDSNEFVISCSRGDIEYTYSDILSICKSYLRDKKINSILNNKNNRFRNYREPIKP